MSDGQLSRTPDIERPQHAPTGWCRFDDNDGEGCAEHATAWGWHPVYGWAPACDEHADAR